MDATILHKYITYIIHFTKKKNNNKNKKIYIEFYLMKEEVELGNSAFGFNLRDPRLGGFFNVHIQSKLL